MYDWTSEITGTGDRSEYILESTVSNTVIDTRIQIYRHCLHPLHFIADC